jgi:hypothetical protein
MPQNAAATPQRRVFASVGERKQDPGETPGVLRA